MFGEKFGRLIVLIDEPIKKKYYNYFHCLCDCGKDKWIRKDSLTTGLVKSCGCYHKEKMKEVGAKQVNLEKLNLIGQSFGRFTIISYAGYDKFRKDQWLCRCECGVEKIIKNGNLISGRTKSCGCLNIDSLKQRHIDYRISKGNRPNAPMKPKRSFEREGFAKSGIIQEILKRDCYSCQFCPDINHDLEIHHILSWSTYPELRYEPSNLITLCKICHIPIIHNNKSVDPPSQTTNMLRAILTKKYGIIYE